MKTRQEIREQIKYLEDKILSLRLSNVDDDKILSREEAGRRIIAIRGNLVSLRWVLGEYDKE